MSLTIPVDELVNNSSDPLLATDPTWDRITLGKVAKILNGFAFKSELFTDSKGLPLIRIRDIANNKTECFYDGPFDENYIVNPEDLLVGMDGDFNCSTWKGPRALLNQRVCKIEVNSNLYSKNFLGFVLPGYLKAIHENTSSQTVKHLSSHSISQIPLPFPPLPEQQRIVARIETLLSHVNAARERLDRVPLFMKRFRQGVLAAACCGRLTDNWRSLKQATSDLDDKKPQEFLETGYDSLNFKFRNEIELPQTWTYAALKDLGRWYSGGTPSKSHDEYWSGGKIPWISAKDMKKEILTDSQDHITESGLNSGRLHLLPQGTILFVVRGLILARDFPIALTECEATINQDMKAIVPHAFVNNRYLLQALQQESPKILFATKESTHGTKRLETESLQYWPIPLPPLAEQHEIVRRVNELFARADVIEREVAVATKRAEALTQAVLARAFRGELINDIISGGNHHTY